MSQAPVRWGVLGAARIARTHVIPGIRASGNGEVVAVSSASGGAPGYAAELGIPRAYGSHAELLADPDVEAVYVPLPNAQHATWILRAAEAGKHVLCEKPLVTGPAELDQVEQVCARAGVHLAEAFMYRHHPQIRRTRELLADGVIGELVAVSARFHFALERTSEPDIRLMPELAGGALRDVGCYPLDLFGALLDRTPEEVAAVACRDTDGGVDTRLAALLRYGRVTATFDCSFDAAFRNEAVLVGSAGAITLPNAFRADVTGGTSTILLDDVQGQQVLEVAGDQYRAEVEHFADRVRHGVPDPDGARLTRLTVETLDRVVDAAGLR